ncbi:hypothetical protein HFO17_12070 [Rhizobium laguerreae]|uniref:hypothetical protein n=1 Tax=Rhizobium laguerreae TaxID=1076926 RepID=UPI001C908C5E|nr:hypothetical protein [Rhizobium laguerreae]MBY3235273.1 hypothetical protein [Rhizobium laguerreae]
MPFGRGKARVAFVAIRATNDYDPNAHANPDNLEAVVVGTNDDKGADWRYVCYSLSDLNDIITLKLNPFAPGAPYEARARYYDGSGINPHSRPIDDHAIAPPASTIELTRIVLCTFYRTPGGDATADEILEVFDEGPLARFDTIGFARTPDGQPVANRAVSRVEITTVAGQPGKLTGFTLRLQVRVALNGHRIRQTVARNDDRYDTRIHLILTAEQNNAAQSLWRNDIPFSAALCSEILVSLTIGPFDSVNPALSVVNIHYFDTDLLGALIVPGAANKVSDPIDVSPFLQEQGISQPTLPHGGFVTVSREFGLRALQTKPYEPNPGRGVSEVVVRIGLRLELTLQQYRDKVTSVLERFFPDPAALPSQAAIRFAQEQRLEEVASKLLVPYKPASWIVSMRVDPPIPDPKGAGDKSLDQVTDFIIGLFDRSIEEEHRGLRRVRGAAPVSAMPRLSKRPQNPGMAWQAVGLLMEVNAWKRVLVPESSGIDAAIDKDRQAATVFLSFEPRFISNMWDGLQQKANVSQCTAEFSALTAMDGTAPTCIARLAAPLVASNQSFNAEDCTFRPAWQPAVAAVGALTASPSISVAFGLDHTDGNEVALGALAFQLTKDPDFTSVFQADLTGLLAWSAYPDNPGDLLQAQLQGQVKFPIDRVWPIGQDDLPADVQSQIANPYPSDRADPDAPLLLELEYPDLGVKAAETTIQALVATEDLKRGANHSLALSLRARQPAAADGSMSRRLALVIDPTPFRVAAVEYIEPARAASDQSNEVAVWSNAADVSWSVLDPSETIRVVTPPQVIGEAMEKNGISLYGAAKDIEPARPAAARFGAHGRLEIDPSFFDKNFREPGWNLRRNLGYPTMSPPGSRLRDLRLELLYGLTTRIIPSQGTSDTFITEIGGAIGAAVRPVPDGAGDGEISLARHLSMSKLIFDAQRRRLAVDKVWSGKPDAELKIENGIDFRLRTSEIGGHGPATALRWPVSGEMPADETGLIDTTVLRETFSTSQDDKESFPGGVAWAFESPNILMKVYSQPRSVGGWAKGIYLSSHGAYGSQRALFDEKKTAIETETGQGRVHRYKLERIGRIGGLWNRAKHVIIYERSVVPSAQFYNLDPIGRLQDEHAGRPILRKMEEYVELLQPVRAYPEDGTSIAAAGFLIGAEFKSVRIRVDSRWGGDVRREGWQVPLWNKAFASTPARNASNPDDPSFIYPKPQIRFLMAGEGGGEISVEIDEPEKLVFYTSVVVGESGDNTDLWRPVREIDFVDMPVPATGRVKPDQGGLSDAILPGEPSHVPGFERMTIGLVRAKEAAVLTNGRAASGPGAVFRNVTIARAAPIVVAGGQASISSFGQAMSNGSANIRAAIDANVGQALAVLERLDPTRGGQVKGDAVTAMTAALARPDMFGGIAAATADLKTALPAGLGAFKSPCDSMLMRLQESVRGQTDRFRLTASNAIDMTLAGALAPVLSLSGFANDLIIAISEADAWLSPERRAELIDELTGLQVRIATLADEVVGDIEMLSTRTVANLDALKAVAGATFGDVHDATVTTAVSDIHGFVLQVRDTIASATNNTDPIRAFAGQMLIAARSRVMILDQVMSSIDDPALLAAARRILPAVHDEVAVAIALFVEISSPATPVITQPIKDRTVGCEAKLAKLEVALDQRLQSAGGSIAQVGKLLDAIITAAQMYAGQVVEQIEDVIDSSIDQSKSLFDYIASAIIILSGPDDSEGDYDRLLALRETLKELLIVADIVSSASTALSQGVTTALNQTVDSLAAQIVTQVGVVSNELTNACTEFDFFVNKLTGNAQLAADWLENALDLDGYRARLTEDLTAAIGSADASIDDIKRRASEKAAELARAVEGRARQITGALQETLRDALGADPIEFADQATRLYQQGSDTLRVLRAVGDPPSTDRLGFNRPEVAYVLAETNKIVDMTPALALVNRVSDTLSAADKAGKAVGDLLQPFGVRMPTIGVAEQLVADKLKQLPVSDLIPNMAGIDFRGLLQRFAFPDLDDSKALKIRHGFDSAQMLAWLQADIDVSFPEPATLLSFGPVEIIVEQAQFNATAKTSTGRDGTKKTVNGRIFGDWRVVASGQDIITFVQTALTFDDTGKIDFQIEPDRVELADALEFLTNFLAASGGGDGLVVEPFMRGGVPSGVAATLDVMLPDLQLGVFGISNLSLHVLFGVAALPEFELMCDLSVATKTMPFTLSVWILNGGGFLAQRLSFLPTSRPSPVLSYSLEVGIVAGVGLGFNFGVVSGGVWLQVGCSITMTWTTGHGGNTTAISVFILARGNVDVAGLITAGISLLLDVSYDGSSMIGSGTLRLSFKISMFYTLRVNQHVQYLFAGEKKRQDSYSGSYA